MNHPIRIALVALLLMAGADSIQAQVAYWQQLDKPYGGNVLFFRTAPNGTIYTSDEQKGIYRSSDEGATWSQAGPPLMPVLITSQNSIFAISDDDGGEFRSTDNGANWTPVNEGLDSIEPGFMTETSAGTILMSSRNGIFRSTSNGDMWTSVGLDSVEFRFLATAPDGTIFAASEERGIYRSTDDGVTWSPAGNMEDSPADAFLFGEAGEVIVGTDNGVYRSLSNGDFYAPFALMGDHIGPFGLKRLPGGDLLATTRTTGLYRIGSDGSAQRLFTVPSNGLYGLELTPSGHILLGYAGRGILRSTDQGESFSTVGIAGGVEIRSFAEADDGSVYALPDRGIYRTSDRGQTWSELLLSEQEVRRIDFSSTGGIFVAGAQGSAFHSSDNGATWTNLQTDIDTDFSGVVVTASDAVIMSSNSGIIRSTDNGISWTRFHSEENVYALAQSPNGNLTGVGFGKIFRSSDEGVTWESLELPEEHTGLGSFAMIAAPTDNVVVIGSFASGTGDPNMLRSTDNGTTWTPVAFPCSTFRLSPSTAAAGIMYASSRCGIYRSLDAGATWNSFRNLPDNETFGVFFADSRQDYWFGGENGIHIYIQGSGVRAGGGRSGILELGLFPNPTQGRATAGFTLQSRRHVTLSIRTLLGETMAVLLDTPVEAGSHAVRFDEDLPAGSYIVHLRAGDDVTSAMIHIVR